MIGIYELSVIIFLLILGILIYRDRKNVEFKYILIIKKTKKGKKLLDKIAKFKNFWKIIGIVGIISCFFLIINGFISLIETSRLIIAGKIKEVPGGIVLPSPEPEARIGVGYILVPFWFWIITVPTILFPHEIAHGIMSRVEKIKIKSVGLFLLLIFPGAFVEPDERELKKSKLLSKLKIFTAGSFINVIFAFLLFNPLLQIGLIPNVIWPALVPSQVQLEVLLTNVTEDGPAAKAGLKDGIVITEINKMQIEISYLDYMHGGYLTKYLQDVKVGDEIEIVANNTKYIVKVGEIIEKNKTRPYLGITTTIRVKGNFEFFNFLIKLLFWMWLLNFAIAVFNILPIYPLDGGLILQALTEKITKKYQKEIVGAITVFTLSLVLFTIFGPSIIARFRFS